VRTTFISCVLCFTSFLPIVLHAQDQDHTSPTNGGISTSGIHEIARTTMAVNYRRGETTHLDMKGTDLMPDLTGEAKVINKSGLADIHVDVDNLRPAKNIDVAYLTYVLWTVSPEGQAKNVGELIVKDKRASLHTTTNLQSFALVITCEPDFAVSQPSELVVAENSLRPTTEGRPESVTVRYQVFPRSIYVSQVTPVKEDVYSDNDQHAPLDLLEARNAVRIARDAQAAQYAPEILKHAEMLLNEAEDYYRGNQNKKSIGTVAREAVQTAEEARVTSVRGEEQARIDRERQENQQRAAQAEAQADQSQDEARRAQERADAEAQQRAAAQQQSDQAQQQAQQAQQQAQIEADRRRQIEEQQQAAAQQAQQAQQQAADAQQQAQQAQQQADQAQQQAQAEAQQRTAAEQQNQQMAQQTDEARRQAQEANQRAQSAESQQSELRQKLLAQLNQILATRDSARGLIVSMPDVLFDTGSANLKPTARERLAKVAGVLIAYPDMRIEVDGYTDSTGNPMSNEQLSQERAASVQSYLTQQGVSASSISIHGFGEANPVASNESLEGRQQNRRVELVVSGQSIGTAELTH
jgi:outer membrane protein OmpA-like peptidoglycan-associated protein